ncbi:AAA family ATPase [Jiangella sp. DSM 45060]|uniref:AAA family ATPase n=1 Tax=Jiangella sp. DSM 45060 TaxID=1798224 RepID=UPI00087AF264|nr:AAA family ATPase [Jiangella sp. DSM 45060]SDT35535.1 AAA domain-containing protein [Jiangella sp. DSM 45060]
MVRDIEIPDEPPFIIGELVHESATLLYGRPEAGKSYYAISIAAAVTTGSPWLGKPTQQRRVLFLGLDPGQNRQTRRRVELLPADANFLVSTVRPGKDDAWWSAFADWAQGEGIGLVIVDNLKRLLSRGSVNDDAAVGEVLDHLDMLVDRGIAVLLIHHQGKAGESGQPKTTPMGASCIEGWARHLIRVERQSGTRKCDLIVEGNDVDPFSVTTIHVPEGDGEHGAFFTVAGSASSSKVSRIEQEVTRPDSMVRIARAVLDAGQTFMSVNAAARHLAEVGVEGEEPRNTEAWKKALQRGVFKDLYLLGGNGQPVQAGPTLQSVATWRKPSEAAA